MSHRPRAACPATAEEISQVLLLTRLTTCVLQGKKLTSRYLKVKKCQRDCAGARNNACNMAINHAPIRLGKSLDRTSPCRNVLIACLPITTVCQPPVRYLRHCCTCCLSALNHPACLLSPPVRLCSFPSFVHQTSDSRVFGTRLSPSRLHFLPTTCPSFDYFSVTVF